LIKAKKIHLLLPLLLSLATILPAITFKAQASPMAELYVDPASILDPTLVPPKTFDVNVSVANVTNLYGYEFNMLFNPNVLTCLYVIVNDVLGETSYTVDTLTSNINGFVWVEVAYYSPATPISTSAPVALAMIHFRVKSPGTTVLHLHDTSLTDQNSNPIPHNVLDGLVQTVIHDVAVTSVTPASSWAYQGWLLNINVVAKNLGNTSETFNVTTYYNTSVVGTILVVNLPSGGQTTLVFTWNTIGVAAGNYTISARASVVPYETNISNNVCINGIVKLLALITLRDVAITNVTPEVNWVYQGWVIKIIVTAKNLGAKSENFNVTAYYDSTIIGVTTVANLAAHTALNLTFNWNTAGLASRRNYTVSANATFVPFEYNITNNVLVDGKVNVRLVGDINGDGIVDVSDVALVTATFGSYPGSPNWNPACDLNRDNIIDISDVATVCANFGKVLPP
jgi:hypothetical protein